MTGHSALLRRAGTTSGGHAFLIRPTRDDDAIALVELHDAVAAEGDRIAALPGDRSLMEQALSLAGLVNGGGLSLTLEVAGAVSGVVLVQRFKSLYHTHIGELAILVARPNRGAGLGRELLSAAIDWARAVGVTRLCLNVLPANRPAIALYESAGFEQEGVRKNQVRLPDGYRDVLAMALLLNGGGQSAP